MSWVGVQTQALCLRQAEPLAGGGLESPFPSTGTGLHTVGFGASTGGELEV